MLHASTDLLTPIDSASLTKGSGSPLPSDAAFVFQFIFVSNGHSSLDEETF